MVSIEKRIIIIFFFKFQWENPNGDESGGKSRRIMFDDPESRIRLDNSETGTLIIANANLEDSGKYVCRAENKYSKNPVIESAVIDVRRRSKAVSPEYQKAVIKVRKSKTHFLNV